MSIPGLKSWIISTAVLVLALVYANVTGGHVTFDLSLGGLIWVGIIALAAYNWGGWKRS
jgi:hypothetical protein